MRALVFTGPGKAEVHDVPEPEAGPGQVVIEVDRVAATVGLDEVAEVFAGHRPAGAGPKIHVDPRR